ncbi:RNA polymerase sigma factor [Streptomyces sp. IBSBF 3136]|uniref:RNA polymerase sigma factor n=1 Tax=Streptomyces sp. IBSBF 3136 TaxID=2903524 RepID=UPI002FDBF3C1
MKRFPWIPGQRGESILPLLCPEKDLPEKSLAQWGYIADNERSFRRHVLVNVGEVHEGDVSDKTFQSLHGRLKKGPVDDQIKDYAWKSFNNAVRKFHTVLAKQRKRELLIGDETWTLDEAPMPVAGYPVDFDVDSVAATVTARLEMKHYKETLSNELSPGELIALALVKFDGYTSPQAAQLLGITDGAVRNAVGRAKAKAKDAGGELGLA